MKGLGTIINTIAVIAGSGIGMFLKNGMKQKMQDILMQTCGVAVIFIGVAGTLQGMITVADGIIQTKGAMLLIFSLVIGGVIGQAIDIEKLLDALGEKIKTIAKAKEDNRFVEGFVNTSLIICVGAMAIVGSIQDGLKGDYSMLAAKSILDFVIVLVFASTYGLGVMFSSIPILVYQGGITILTVLVGPFLGKILIENLSYVGSALIFCVGVNIAFGKKFNVGNMLPALFVPVAYELILYFIK
ncbi:DUF554 domain-containing protein [Clostridium magnum]|uniref:Putative membrane protein YdfK n=1 Tax=Clostridium magnum DSM 2767 TaxID=1121326 RepID=A0A161WU77_9CLOT|nr:DUF554 domain-containing protein [Clostridium magnum]KZL90428.1 putative membrane protein YdfK [Clostridium magnum DSM 2767]SHH84908.1 hypothetical protein SAMN02745944_01576 [Clostridium magnum DSM 2767]